MADARLQPKRDRVLDSYMDGALSKTDRDRRLAQVDGDIAAVEVREEVVQLSTIDWDHDDPGAINVVLRSIWRSVQLGPDLMPVSGDWRAPQWRAE